ncbi:CD225 dispanin family, partial [Paramuricea clavata]
NQPQLPNAVPPVFNDRITLSVIVWFCCCPLIGILAILKSFEAKTRYINGDYAGAEASARTAKKLSHAAIICGLILYSVTISVTVVDIVIITKN